MASKATLQRESGIIPLQFPLTKNILWDHTGTGSPVYIHIAYYRDLKLSISLKTLQLAQRYAEDSRTQVFHCILIGSVIVDPDGEGVSVVLDRFDPGVQSPGEERSPSMEVPGDLHVPFWISKHHDVKKMSHDTYCKALKVLHHQCSSSRKIDMCGILSLSGHCFYGINNNREVESKLTFDLVTIETRLKATPVRPVPIVPTALSKNLSGPASMSDVQGEPKTGYLTMDHVRKILLVLESDPKVYSLPLVGIWVSGIQAVHDPFIWAACIRYLHNSSIQERVCQPPEGFLLVLYSPAYSKPEYYEVTTVKGTNKLTFDLYTCHETVCTTKSDSKQQRSIEMDFSKVQHGEKYDIFCAALEQLSNTSQSPVRPCRTPISAEDMMPRASPSPHLSKVPSIKPSVPDVSLIVDDPVPAPQPAPQPTLQLKYLPQPIHANMKGKLPPRATSNQPRGPLKPVNRQPPSLPASPNVPQYVMKPPVRSHSMPEFEQEYDENGEVSMIRKQHESRRRSKDRGGSRHHSQERGLTENVHATHTGHNFQSQGQQTKVERKHREKHRHRSPNPTISKEHHTHEEVPRPPRSYSVGHAPPYTHWEQMPRPQSNAHPPRPHQFTQNPAYPRPHPQYTQAPSYSRPPIPHNRYMRPPQQYRPPHPNMPQHYDPYAPHVHEERPGNQHVWSRQPHPYTQGGDQGYQYGPNRPPPRPQQNVYNGYPPRHQPHSLPKPKTKGYQMDYCENRRTGLECQCNECQAYGEQCSDQNHNAQIHQEEMHPENQKASNENTGDRCHQQSSMCSNEGLPQKPPVINNDIPRNINSNVNKNVEVTSHVQLSPSDTDKYKHYEGMAAPEMYELLLKQDAQLKLLQAQIQQLLAAQQNTPPQPRQMGNSSQNDTNAVSPESQGYVSMETVETPPAATKQTVSIATNTSLLFPETDRTSSKKIQESGSRQPSPLNSYSNISEPKSRPESRVSMETGSRTNSHHMDPAPSDLPSEDLSMTLSGVQVPVQDRTVQSFVSDMVVDIPSYQSSPTRSPGQHHGDTSFGSPVLGESASMCEVRRQCDEDDEEGDKDMVFDEEEPAVDTDQLQCYDNLLKNVKALLARHDAGESHHQTQEDTHMDVHAQDETLAEDLEPGSSDSSGADVVQATLEQLKKMGVGNTEEILTNVKGDQAQSFDYETAFLPKLNYVSLMLDDFDISETDMSMEVNALAMKYLSDDQLSSLAKMTSAKKRPRKDTLLQRVLVGNSGRQSASDVTVFGMSPNNMSFATQKYMERYGLIKTQKQPGKEDGILEKADCRAREKEMNLATISENRCENSDKTVPKQLDFECESDSEDEEFKVENVLKTIPQLNKLDRFVNDGTQSNATETVQDESLKVFDERFTQQRERLPGRPYMEQMPVQSSENVLDLDRLRELPKLM